MARKPTPFVAAVAIFLRAFPWELLCVTACAVMFLIANCEMRDSYDFSFGGSPLKPHFTVYGWPAHYLQTKTIDWPPRLEQFRYEFNWSGLMLNATFSIAIGVLGVITIRFVRHRQFTLAMGGTFVFYACIAAGALRAAWTMHWVPF
jgi:hypothetical protein